jgi:hypothetical protein
MARLERVEAIATERNTHVLRTIAEAERTIARNHEARGAHSLAAIHHRIAEQLSQLLDAADDVWNGNYTTRLGGF